MNRNLDPPIRLLYAADSAEDDEFYRVLERQPDFSAVGFSHEKTLDHVISADCVVVRHGTGVDGIAVLETVRERYPDLPVVLLGPDDGVLAAERSRPMSPSSSRSRVRTLPHISSNAFGLRSPLDQETTVHSYRSKRSACERSFNSRNEQ
ncbi:hypothetical protein ACFQJ8_16510 [Halocatena marina]|uniref:hypothetical protein n=1 Tax=Halocatena marina TaxID=2934937 RepID=UPI00361B46C0